MRNSFFVTACLGILLAGVAHADLGVGDFAPEIKAKEWLNTEDGESVTLGEMRGLVVVLFFFVSFHEGGKSVMGDINILENHPALGRKRGVVVIGLTDSDRKRTEGTLHDEKGFFPVGLESKSGSDYRIESYPRVVVVDPKGKVAWSGWPGQGDELVRAVLDVLAANPPVRSHPEEAKMAIKHIDLARTALREKRYRDAFKAARDASEYAVTGDPLKTRAQDVIDLVEALGRDSLAGIDADVDAKKFEEAVKTLRGVIRQFRGLEVAKSAAKRLESLKEQHEPVAKILESQKGEAEARAQLLQAIEDIRGRRFGEAYEKLEGITKSAPASEAAEYAGPILERLKKNSAAMAVVRDHLAERDAQSWLSQANSFVRARQYDRARELYQKIVTTYPNTTWADKAKEQLFDLP